MGRTLLPLPAVSVVLGQQYLLERYETEYGIYDHDSTRDRLAILLYHEAEDPLAFSHYTMREAEYIDGEVLKYFGLNFLEFLSLPRAHLERLLKTCERLQKQEYEHEEARRRAAEAAARQASQGAQ